MRHCISAGIDSQSPAKDPEKGIQNMGDLGLILGIMRMSMGVAGLSCGVVSINGVGKLEKSLKESGVMSDDFRSSWKYQRILDCL